MAQTNAPAPQEKRLLSGKDLFFMAMGQTIGALLAAVLVLFYNGQRGPDDHRLFYWAYPAHLTVLWAISALTVYTTCV